MTTAIELCEDIEDLEEQLQVELTALLNLILQPADLEAPGFRGGFVTRHHGRPISMSWRNDRGELRRWPHRERQMVPVRLIMFQVGKQFDGLPVTLFNGTAHASQVNHQGIVSFTGEEALRIFRDTHDLRISVW